MKKVFLVLVYLFIVLVVLNNFLQAKDTVKKGSQKQRIGSKLTQKNQSQEDLVAYSLKDLMVVATNPEDMSELDIPPASVDITFNNNIKLDMLNINVMDSDGNVVEGSVSQYPKNPVVFKFTPKSSFAFAKDYIIRVTPSEYIFCFAVKDQNISNSKDQKSNRPVYTPLIGFISQDTTWTKSNSPYVTLGNVVVKEGVTLTIDPGVIVKFDSKHTLIVEGTLIAKGTQEEKIKFTSKEAKKPEAWGGILFRDNSIDAMYDSNGNYLNGNILQHCVVEFAESGVKGESASQFINYCTIWNNVRGVDISNVENVFMQNNVIKNNNYNGIFIEKAKSVALTGNTVRNNGRGETINNSSYGIIIKGDSIVISNNALIQNGGGIYAEGVNVTIKDNLVEDNGVRGGIIIRSNTSSINNNYLIRNVLSYVKADVYGTVKAIGGGICVDSNSATITNNVLVGNIARAYYSDSYADGGGIYVNGDSTTIANNTLVKNKAEQGVTESAGGGIYVSGKSTVIKGNNLIRNETRGYGGGIYVKSKTATIDNNNMIGNTGACGGGIFTSESSAIVSNNTLIKNVATGGSHGVGGGGICIGGIFDGGVAIISHNTVSRNIAKVGGGIYIAFAPETVINNNIIKQNSIQDQDGSAIYCLGSKEISSNIFVRNISGGYEKPNAVYIKGNPKFTMNAFIDNQIKYNLYYDLPKDSPDFNATNNYWGRSNEIEIRSMIYDSLQNNNLALVNVVPFLAENPVRIDIPIEKANIQASIDTIYFEDASIDNTADQKLTISNAGESAFTLNSIVSDNTAFTVLSPSFPQNVSPGQKLDVTIRFSPVQEKYYTGVLIIESNNYDEPRIHIPTQGLGQKTWKLKVISTPSGANIVLNEVNHGITPNIIQLPTGSYKLKLSKEGYLDMEETVTVESEKSLQWNVRLYRLPPINITGKYGGVMVQIPAGEFQMGKEGSKEQGFMGDEKPVHTVYLDTFYIDKYEVTNALYKKFVQATGYKEPSSKTTKLWSNPDFNEDSKPVVYVNWEDAKAYAEWAGKRLPTEAEWEKAAYEGVSGWKEADIGNYSGTNVYSPDRYEHTAYVGMFPPNAYGLYDVNGNVSEWCADWYDRDYYANSPRQNPKGPDTGQRRIVRGQDWIDSKLQYELKLRWWCELPSESCSSTGFRCAMDLPKQYKTSTWMRSIITDVK